MYINTTEEKMNILVSDLVFLACRKRETFSRFDNAIKDDPAFVIDVVKREEENKGHSYHRNTTLSCALKLCDTMVELQGNVSIFQEDEEYVVDVVKSLRYPIKQVSEVFIYDWLCEAKCLAFIFAKKRSLKSVATRISVFHTETLERRTYRYCFSYTELECFFKETVKSFSAYASLMLPHIKSRNEKNSRLGFPFSDTRDGQKEISKEVYSAIKHKHNVIVNAPTGLGKTVATLYPALKAQSSGLCNKVFYLTAKSSGSNAVLDAIRVFEKAGYDVTVSVISAKHRICDKRPCSPINCKKSAGHHDRVLSAVFEIASKYKVFNAEIVSEYSNKYDVCPFMLEMELVSFADVVVGDYNYVFDPAVSSKIISSLSGNDAVLVDEAHNLIDRMRYIFSAEIKISELKKISDGLNGKSPLCASIDRFLNFIKNDVEDSDGACEPMSSQTLDGFEREINLLFSDYQEYFEGNNQLGFEAVTLFNSMKSFVDMLTLRSDNYLAFFNDEGNPEIFLADTSKALFEKSKQLGSLILFSATLFPEEYYKYMLGACDDDAYVSFPSPFDRHNLLVLGYPLSTKYSDREQTAEDVARAIYSAGRAKQGNYISFFSSYRHMSLVLESFTRLFPDEKVIFQKPSMTDEEKSLFISSFSPRPTITLYAFAVLGGVFSEGIDLVGEKLSGATVVGLGALPPSRKNSLLSSYFSDLFFDGDKFAYYYPGLNKVFQAGGRVIRSENDKGFLLIIDDRFLTEENIELLPESWHNLKRVKDNNSITSNLCDFWQSEKT